MAKLAKPGPMPTLDTGEGAPTFGRSKAMSTLNDGTSRGRKVPIRPRPLFGGLGGGALTMAKGKTGPKKAPKPPGGGGGRVGYGKPPPMGPRGAGNMDADTKKYGAMMARKK